MSQRLEKSYNGCLSLRGVELTSSLSIHKTVLQLPSLALEVQKVPRELLIFILKWWQGNSGSDISEGTRSSIRTIKLRGRTEQEGRWPSFYHTPFHLDCSRKVLPIIQLGLPASIKATRTLLQPGLPTQMILISGKLTLKPTVLRTSTLLHTCSYGKVPQLLFHHVRMQEWGTIYENPIRYLNATAPWSYLYEPPEPFIAHQWPSQRYFVTASQINQGTQIEHIICHVQKRLSWLS